MSRLHKRIEQIWWNPCRPPLLLRCIEPVYAAISSIHLKRRAARNVTLPLPLISVGNITAGGSGKTPFVLWLADALDHLGYSPVILCRGDGGKISSPAIVSPDSDVELVGDEAKMLGGYGCCGLPLCCTTFLKDFEPVSIRMAKDQNLVLNPQKVSGQCGRLKCCLAYEEQIYREQRQGMPKMGKRVVSPDGPGRQRPAFRFSGGSAGKTRCSPAACPPC